MSKNKHLNLEDRCDIAVKLKENLSFRNIAKDLEKSTPTISNEIKKHIILEKKGAYGRNFNDCKHRKYCTLTKLCDNIICKIKYCCFCSECYMHCKEYEKEVCIKLNKAPFVCNGCKDNRKCTLERHIYSAKYAQDEYENTLKEARTGYNITEEQKAYIDSIVSPAVLRGISISAICEEYKGVLMVDEKTIYNYINNGLLCVKNIDLPKLVKYKPRIKKSKIFKVDKGCRINRNYENFKSFILNKPDANIVEIDTVEGIKGGKVILTIYFRTSNLMLGFLRDNNDSKSVTDSFKNIYELLGKELYKQLFEVILTDNGSEFSNPEALEYMGIDKKITSEKEIYVFYCDPSAPGQKGGIEHNHTLLRRIVPKHTSFNDFTQQDVALIFNNINNYSRDNLNKKTPYNIFNALYGDTVCNKLGIKYTDFNALNLTPNLLKKNKIRVLCTFFYCNVYLCNF